MKKVCASNKGGRKPAPWNDNYRGYKIRLDTAHGCYVIYDKNGEMEDSGYRSKEDCYNAIDNLISESVYGSSNIEEDIDKKIADYLYDRLHDEFEDNLVLQVSSDIKEYDAMWALPDYDPNRRAERQLNAARAAYIEALVDAFTWCRDMYSE